jgi:hypothetical protein
MSITLLRERAGRALLHVGSQLAVDQMALERGLAEEASRRVVGSSAESAAAMARWVDEALLWLGWRLLPVDVARVVRPPAGSR